MKKKRGRTAGRQVRLALREARFAARHMAAVLLAVLAGSAALPGTEAAAAGLDTFVHKHNNNCYKTVTFQCASGHEHYYTYESTTKHCSSCGQQQPHKIVWEYAKCKYLASDIQAYGEIVCNVCGALHSRWGPGESHQATRQELACGVAEGTATGVLKVSNTTAGWTNGSALLQADIQKLNDKLIVDGLAYSWDGGAVWGGAAYGASVNGTYTVMARNASGETVSASVTVSNIDKMAPVIKEVRADTGNMTRDAVTVTVQAEDAPAGEGTASGLAEQPYSADGGQSWQEESSFRLLEGKPCQLVVRDRAGNRTERELNRADYPYPPEPAIPPSGAAGAGQEQQGAPGKDTGAGLPPAGTVPPSGGVLLPGGNGQDGESVEVPAPEKTQGDSEKNGEKETGGGKGGKADPEKKKAAGTENTGQGRKAGAKKSAGKNSADYTENTVKDEPGDGVNRSINGLEAEHGFPGLEKGYPASGGRKQPVKVELEDMRGDANTAEAEGTGAGTIPVIDAVATGPGKTLPAAIWDGAAAALPAAVGIAGAAFLWLAGRVTVYRYTGDCRYERLGRARVRKCRGGYRVALSDGMLQKAPEKCYRIAVNRFLRQGERNAGLTVSAFGRKYELGLEEFVDFVL